MYLEWIVLSPDPKILLALAARLAMFWLNLRVSWTSRPGSLVQKTGGMDALEALEWESCTTVNPNLIGTVALVNSVA